MYEKAVFISQNCRRENQYFSMWAQSYQISVIRITQNVLSTE